MKKAVFTLICSLAFAAGGMAQDAPLDVSKRVADYLLSHHNHNVSKAQDGHTHIDSYYQEWKHRCIGGRAGFDLAHPVPQWPSADFQAGGS